MKRICAITIITVFILTLILSGCGRGNTDSSVGYDDSEDYIVLSGPEDTENGNAKTESQGKTNGDEDADSDLESITQQIVNNKKLQQYERSNANTEIVSSGDIKNILIIGQDRRAGDKAEMRSDAMMIFSINTVTNQINLVSLMRDMYIPCADGKEGMINMTYYNGQAPLLEKTIEMNFGVHIDNYIEVDFWEFMDLFDAIGPIDVELTTEEATYLSDMSKSVRVQHYDYGDEKPQWTFHAGINSLDPEQCLSFCRVRKDIGGDWGRTGRQRRFITATYQKLMDMSTAGLIRLVKDCHKFFTTDMSVEDMLGYLYTLKKNNISQINGYLIPIEGSYTQEIREETLHVLIPNIEQNKQAIQQYIYGNS